MATRRAPYGQHITRPAGVKHWYFRYQYPKDVWEEIGRKKAEFPLTDSQGQYIYEQSVANIAKLSHLEEHRLKVWSIRNKRGHSIDGIHARRLFVKDFAWRFPLGESTLECGSRCVATETVVLIFAPDGVMREERNERVPVTTFAFVPKSYRAPTERSKRTRIEVDVDSEIIESYLLKRRYEINAAGQLKKDRSGDAAGMRRTLHDLKIVTDGKRLDDVTYSDIGKLITRMREEHGIRFGRIKKLLALMRAACNSELRKRGESRIKSNPFDKFEIDFLEGDEEVDRPPYTSNDIAVIKANLDLFPPDERLMLIWHIASGVRPNGLHSIRREFLERDLVDGVEVKTRSVEILSDKDGRKIEKKYGKRSLPIPQAVLDSGLLPQKIEGPIWERSVDLLLVAINKKLKKIGVNVDGKSLYSGRDRARDQWRGLDPRPEDQLTRAILGHARALDPHEGYGHGYRMRILKPYVDAVGF